MKSSRRWGERVQCHVCEGWYRSLEVHALRRHGLAAGDYRAGYGLVRAVALIAPRLAEVRRVRALRDARRNSCPNCYAVE